MNNLLIPACSALITILFFSSCEKENATSSYLQEKPNQVDHVFPDLKSKLASSENGWVIMVKRSLDKGDKFPVMLKFDTLKNRVNMTMEYDGKTVEGEGSFRIANHLGVQKLIFSSESIIATLFGGDKQVSDVTDYIFTVKGVSENEIDIQPDKVGRNFRIKEEDVYRLFKKPVNWVWVDKSMEIAIK